MALYHYVCERPARSTFAGGTIGVRSRLQPMIEVVRMLQRRFESVIAFLRPRVTNATRESINAKIQG